MALDLASVPRVRPSPVPAGAGAASPGEALDAGGGIPGGDASPRPLLAVVNDPDRATRTAEALAALRARAGSRRIDLLVATGSHRWSTEERVAHAGPLIAAAGAGARVHWHDGHLPAHSEPLPGTGRALAKVLLRLAESSDVVAVGSVEPHWFAGVTGAHKTITVGLMTADEIARNHRLAMDPAAAPLRLGGNPVFDDLRPVVEEVVALTRVLAVQHVHDRWTVGCPLATLPALAEAAAARWRLRVERPLDFVVARVDPPLSHTLYQAEKGVKMTEHAVRDGGTIALVADCARGLGPPRFAELLNRAPDAIALRALVDAEGYRLGDHKAVRLRALLDRGVRLILVGTGVDEAAARLVGFEALADDRALDRRLSGDGVVVEDAGHCVLEVSP